MNSLPALGKPDSVKRGVAPPTVKQTVPETKPQPPYPSTDTIEVKPLSISDLEVAPKVVMRVHEVKPKPPDYCGTNYMEGYHIGRVIEHLKIDKVPEGCGCGCRGTKKLAKMLDMDIGCSLKGLQSNWDESMSGGSRRSYSPTTYVSTKWGLVKSGG